MKLLFILFFTNIFFINCACAQFYFGGNKLETKQQMLKSESDLKILSDTGNSIVYTLMDRNTSGKIIFDKNDKAYMQVLMPHDQLSLNKWVTGFNSSCVIVSDKEWNIYMMGKTYVMKLVYSKDTYLFVLGEKN